MPLKFNVVPQIVLSSHDAGVDWGGKRKLLARHRDKILFWVLGHTGWFQVGHSKYYPGFLAVQPKEGHYGSSKTLYPEDLNVSARLSTFLLLRPAQKFISDNFCSDLAVLAAIHPKKTVVIK